MNLQRIIHCFAFFAVILSLTWTVRARKMIASDPFRVYSLSSDWGFYSAAFSPDESRLAVIAVQRPRKQQETEGVREIQIWNLRERKLIAEKVLSTEAAMDQQWTARQPISLYGYVRSGSMILLYREGQLVLVDSQRLEEIRRIDLDIGHWPKFPQSSGEYSFMKDAVTDRDGHRVAVLLQWGLSGGGEFRIYDLDSGYLVRKWDYRDLRNGDRNAKFGGADLSSDGRTAALSLIPFALGQGELRSKDHNVFVLEVDSGAIVAAINTGYPAGQVRFAPTDPSCLLTVSEDNFDKHRSHADTIKVWDPRSGNLLRELTPPLEGVHFEVAVSSNGKRVLGYTGLEKFAGRWWLGQEEYGLLAYDRFSIWDLNSGRIIASSPEIASAQSHRQFLLSPQGDIVLMYPTAAGGSSLTFYELSSEN